MPGAHQSEGCRLSKSRPPVPQGVLGLRALQHSLWGGGGAASGFRGLTALSQRRWVIELVNKEVLRGWGGGGGGHCTIQLTYTIHT